MNKFFICLPNGKVEIGPHEGVKNLWPVGTVYIETDHLNLYFDLNYPVSLWRRKNSSVSHGALYGSVNPLKRSHEAFFMLLGLRSGFLGKAEVA